MTAHLVALILVAVVLPWVLLFLLWRSLRANPAARLRTGRLIVGISMLLGLSFSLWARNWSSAAGSVVSGGIFLMIMSGRFQPRLLSRIVGALGLVVGGFVAWGTWSFARDVISHGGEMAWLGWCGVALCAMLTWIALGTAAWMLWWSTRPSTDLSTPAPKQF
jgi:hypothetical protein